HARSLGEIGLFKIVTEGGVAAGVRRIEAVTGLNALEYVRQMKTAIDTAARGLSTTMDKLPTQIDKLQSENRRLEKEVAELKKKLVMGGGGGGGGGMDDMLKGARDIPGGKALAVKVEAGDAATLRELAEKLRDKLGQGVVLVGSVTGPKAS